MLEETKKELKHQIPNITETQTLKIKKFVEEAFLFNKKHNIFVRTSIEEVYEKDVLDCLPLIHEIDKAQKVLDLGSGGGFPVLMGSYLSGWTILAIRYHLYLISLLVGKFGRSRILKESQR